MRCIRNQKGVAMVEFAIALPLILLLLCGTIEFGVLFYNKQVITNASREGVRAGIVKGITDSTIKMIVQNYSGNKLIGLKEAVSVKNNDIIITSDGDDLKVTIDVDYPFLFSQIIGVGNSIKISANTVMRKES
jgi:Flp pilus assembly protein TadG